MQTSSKSNQSNAKPSVVNNHGNFIEALKAAGSDVANQVTSTVTEQFDAGLNQGIDSIFSTKASNQDGQQGNEQSPEFNFEDYVYAQEQEQARRLQHERVKYEYEHTETVIFNRRQEEVNKRIEHILLELKQIAQEVVNLDQSTQAVVHQEIVDPGTYHLSYLEKFLLFLQQTRKRMSEAKHWLGAQQNRNKGRSYFWKQADNKIGGTKFLLSQERAVQTQTG